MRLQGEKLTLDMNPRRWLLQDVPLGSALEGLTAADKHYQSQA